MKCPECGTDLEDGVMFCRECGAKLEKKKKFCRECGAVLADGVKFCRECGAKVDFKESAGNQSPIVEKESSIDADDEVDKSHKDSKSRESNITSEELTEDSKSGESNNLSEDDKCGELNNPSEKSSEDDKGEKSDDPSEKSPEEDKSEKSNNSDEKLSEDNKCEELNNPSEASPEDDKGGVSKNPPEKSPKDDKKKPSGSSSHKSVSSDRKVSQQASYNSAGEKIKAKCLEFWSSLDTFCKIATVGLGIIALLLIIGIFAHKGLSVFLSVVQIAGLATAVMMHKEIIQSPKSWLKYFVLGAAILFTAFNVMSLSSGNKKSAASASDNKPPQAASVESKEETEAEEAEVESEPIAETDFVIEKGCSYAYMTDEWNVYIATAVSDSLIQIENWHKNLSTEKSVKHEYDLGTFQINDPENSFTWLDESHTAFSITVKDKNKKELKKGKTAIFTININDSDVNKGSDYDKEIASYLYDNDDWNVYRAIALTPTLIRIEGWTRPLSTSLCSYMFGSDVCVIDTTDTVDGAFGEGDSAV